MGLNIVTKIPTYLCVFLINTSIGHIHFSASYPTTSASMTTFRQKSASFLLYITTTLLQRASAPCTYKQYLRCFNCDAETTLFKQFVIRLAICLATWNRAPQLGNGQDLNRV